MTIHRDQNIPNMRPYGTLLIRQASLEDMGIVTKLINALPITGRYAVLPFGGQLVYIKHVIESSLGVMVLGIDTSLEKGVGYVVAISEPKRFWRTFVVRYPFYAGLLFLKKFLDSINFKARNRAKSTFKWSKGGVENARVIFIGVLPEYRGLGIGQRIYQFFFETLRKNGKYLVEAHIDKGNESSLRLHQRVEFEIEQLDSGDYRSYKTLEPVK